MSKKNFLLLAFIITLYNIIIIMLLLYMDIININALFTNINCVDKTVDNSINEIVNNGHLPYKISTKKICIFTPFIDLFDKSNPSNAYFSGYFVSNNVEYVKEDISLLEFIIYNQYIILDHNTNITTEYIQNMHRIIEEYNLRINGIINP